MYYLYVVCILIVSFVNIHIMCMLYAFDHIILAHNIHIFQFYFIYRAHLENKFLLMKLPGTIEWLKRKRPSVVGEKMYDILMLYIY